MQGRVSNGMGVITATWARWRHHVQASVVYRLWMAPKAVHALLHQMSCLGVKLTACACNVLHAAVMAC